jgi:nucleotide-binding universal stress UspA family protein
MKKILVPTDFSENAKKALQFAAEISINTGAPIEILHVNTAAAYFATLPDQYIMMDSTEFDSYATSAATDLKIMKRALTIPEKFAHLDLETRIENGYLHATLKRIAEEDETDLIVMGTKGATGALEFFVGSNTEKVIRTAPCPVLVVPEKAKDFNLKTVVLATTLHPDQQEAFNEVVRWQKEFHFTVKILYINVVGSYGAVEDIQSKAANLCTESGMVKMDLFPSSNVFNEENAILEFSRANNADLIVMATHQRRGISHLIFGSLTEDTANHSNIPVLCVPI